MTVKNILAAQQVNHSSVQLGEVETTTELSGEQLKQLGNALTGVGFELLDDHRKQQIEKIKNLLIAKVQDGEIEEHFSLTRFLSAALLKDYAHMSKLFSEVEGITLEQFFILQKIEKVKEWLIYNELNVNEIAFRLGYSSVQHLSAQFKKVTGMTPTHFKKLGSGLRKPLDAVVNRKHT
jgi:AraC-like DNA-binding protein